MLSIGDSRTTENTSREHQRTPENQFSGEVHDSSFKTAEHMTMPSLFLPRRADIKSYTQQLLRQCSYN